jgi:hypothetical protein
MGMTDILYGYIIEANPGYGGGPEERALKEVLAKDIRKHNSLIVESFPFDEEWPFLKRQMFHQIPDGHLLNYKKPMIIFGGSFKSICYEWHEWLPKFEKLIRKLYWESIVITMDSEVVGERKFIWTPPDDWITNMQTKLEPLVEWRFEGERKFFDGLDRIA